MIAKNQAPKTHRLCLDDKSRLVDDGAVKYWKNCRKGTAMKQRQIVRVVRLGVLAVTFAAGFLVGSVNRHPADAQLGDLGKAAMEKAEGSGGALGSVAQLGSAIVEMQQHVDGLQKNIEVLKKVKSGLGG
jgi:hypothetical protein